ncbi:MAG: phosphate ABC transporter permease subunit PstC [Maricaulaceae bacterium]
MGVTRLAIYTSVAVSALSILAICLTLILNGLPILGQGGIHLLTSDWNPASGHYGILPMLYGTVTVALIAMLIAAPLGILSAIAISEYLPRAFRIPVKAALELLAGIPSIIYGLIGIALLAPFLSDVFDLQSGRTIFAGGILLAVMILPTIVTLSEDALHNIPHVYRETGAGLGYYRYEIIKDILWPIAKSDIIGAMLLALGRALGETMAVMLVIGSIDRIPSPLTNILSPGQTITSKLGREISETAFGSPHFQALIFMALILLVIAVVLTASAQFMTKTETRLVD